MKDPDQQENLRLLALALSGEESTVSEVNPRDLQYVLYARKSTTGEDRQEKSIDHQVTDCIETVVKPLGINLGTADIIEERGSAKDPDIRPLFRQMIADLKTGKYQGLIAWHPDRLARNMKEAGEIIDLVDKKVIKDLQFATSRFENTPSGKMLLGISFVLSKQFSEHLSEQVSRGNRRKTEKGVGKSKLIKEGVSNALGLPFAFVPLGGVNDGSLLNGHHVVYEGASFGKIAEILINTQTMNPVIFFDELDKVSKKFDTEIESILTHLTDPVQNEKFQDHYFNGIDLDLSKSLFVFSYNDESLISPILRDRMITIHVSGYGIEDKIQICQKHLIEEVASEFNIKRSDIIFSDDIIKKIVSRVDEEKGVRNLKRGIESIISSINIERYLGNTTLTMPIKITESHVNKYIKQKKTSVPLLNMYM
jgi:DNA invertase Pin-like site-specific DNA recombinase